MERPDHKEIKRDPWLPDSIHAYTYLTYLKKIFFSPSTTKKFWFDYINLSHIIIISSHIITI